MKKNIIIWSSGVLALLIVAAGIWYFFFRASAPAAPMYSGGNTPAATLAEQNQDYALAENYQREGNYSLALQYYQKSLANTRDSFQRAQVQFSIAYATELLGNYADAIAQFKAIAADTSNYPISRAASIQDIGLMYFTYSGSTTLQTIVTETFKDPPYDSFKKNTNFNLAYTKLFEYAASIYPLAASEVRIAYGYTNELLNTLHGATTTPQGEEYLNLVTRSLQATDRDLLRMENVSEEKALIPEILVREGRTFDRLATLGAADPRQAEPYFQRGVQYAASLGVKPGSFHAFNYAAFLADRYGSARSADIKKLLAPFTVGKEEEVYSTVVDFYKNTRANPASDKNKKLLIKLGQLDPDFQRYLISLGWTEADFK